MAIELTTHRLYIDGARVEASSDDDVSVINPATEDVIGRVPQASEADVISPSPRPGARLMKVRGPHVCTRSF